MCPRSRQWRSRKDVAVSAESDPKVHQNRKVQNRLVHTLSRGRVRGENHEPRAVPELVQGTSGRTPAKSQDLEIVNDHDHDD